MFDDRPVHPGLLIYDGDCVACVDVASWLARILPSAPTMNTYRLADLAAYGITTSDAKKRVWLVTSAETLGGHLAISGMLRHQPNSALRFTGWLMATPPWSLAAAFGYAVVTGLGHHPGRRSAA